MGFTAKGVGVSACLAAEVLLLCTRKCKPMLGMQQIAHQAQLRSHNNKIVYYTCCTPCIVLPIDLGCCQQKHSCQQNTAAYNQQAWQKVYTNTVRNTKGTQQAHHLLSTLTVAKRMCNSMQYVRRCTAAAAAAAAAAAVAPQSRSITLHASALL
jgi:hypothetical protein